MPLRWACLNRLTGLASTHAAVGDRYDGAVWKLNWSPLRILPYAVMPNRKIVFVWNWMGKSLYVYIVYILCRWFPHGEQQDKDRENVKRQGRARAREREKVSMSECTKCQASMNMNTVYAVRIQKFRLVQRGKRIEIHRTLRSESKSIAKFQYLCNQNFWERCGTTKYSVDSCSLRSVLF